MTVNLPANLTIRINLFASAMIFVRRNQYDKLADTNSSIRIVKFAGISFFEQIVCRSHLEIEAHDKTDVNTSSGRRKFGEDS